jgi:hypothetical protein
VTVSSGAVLGGTGSIAAPVTVANGAFITSGSGATAADAIGTLTISNAVSLQSGSTVVWKIAGTPGSPLVPTPSATPGGSDTGGAQDRLNVTGGTNTLTLVSGTGTLRVMEKGGIGSVTLDPSQSYSFTIATTAGSPGVSGLGVDMADLQTNAPDFFNYGSVSGNLLSLTTSGTNVYLSLTPSPVPEPTTVGLFAVAGLGLVRLVRRDRRKGR